MARTPKRSPDKISGKPPRVISVSATIPFDGTMQSRFGYMESCFECGNGKLIHIHDDEIGLIVRKFCNVCDIEWVR